MRILSFFLCLAAVGLTSCQADNGASLVEAPGSAAHGTTSEWHDLPNDICQTPKASGQGPRRTDHWQEIVIDGSEAFLACTRAALEAAWKTAPFKRLGRFLGRISESEHSGIQPIALYLGRVTPTFAVGNRTWRRGVVWYASSIVHDANHSSLFFSGKPWNGKAGERDSLTVQIEALTALDANPDWITYLEKLRSDPCYQEGDESSRTWALSPGTK